MSYDEIAIEDMEWSENLQAYTYSCPCGDLFSITMVRFACCRASVTCNAMLFPVPTADITYSDTAGRAHCWRDDCPVSKLFIIHYGRV